MYVPQLFVCNVVRGLQRIAWYIYIYIYLKYVHNNYIYIYIQEFVRVKTKVIYRGVRHVTKYKRKMKKKLRNDQEIRGKKDKCNNELWDIAEKLCMSSVSFLN